MSSYNSHSQSKFEPFDAVGAADNETGGKHAADADADAAAESLSSVSKSLHSESLPSVRTTKRATSAVENLVIIQKTAATPDCFKSD